MTRVCALVGSQFGSEGKGVVAASIADQYQVWVRTGGPNAGHSFVYDGQLFKMQAIPCGWINPNATILIGPGGLVSLDTVERELQMIEKVCPEIRKRFFVDPLASVLSDEHHREEGGVDGDIHKRIGSTGEGVGSCRVSRINRNPEKFQRIKDLDPSLYNFQVRDVPIFLDRARRDGLDIMLEGTQGFGLSLTHGPWPHVTSSDTTAAQLAADAGIAPQYITDVILVVRTYPIRVAGNSGLLKGELSWEQMSEQVGKPVKEFTTVTKKPRRIGCWDEELFFRSVIINGATDIVLTFADYLSPPDEYETEWDGLSDTTKTFVRYIESSTGIKVSKVGTGFNEDKGWFYASR